MSVRLRGDLVELRPIRDGEFNTVLAQQLDDPNAEPDGGFAEQLRRRIATSGTWGPVELLLAIEAGGRLIGTVQARRSRDMLPPGVFEIGIGLAPEARGRGYGADAVSALTRSLFDDEGAVRVQLGTDVGNAAMRRAAEKAGFRYEGVMRSFWQVPGGTPRDYALYARTREDHETSGVGPAPGERRDRWIRTS
jgi:RimJ/RimL family protein N-acetyltransferase